MYISTIFGFLILGFVLEMRVVKMQKYDFDSTYDETESNDKKASRPSRIGIKMVLHQSETMDSDNSNPTCSSLKSKLESLESRMEKIQNEFKKHFSETKDTAGKLNEPECSLTEELKDLQQRVEGTEEMLKNQNSDPSKELETIKNDFNAEFTKLNKTTNSLSNELSKLKGQIADDNSRLTAKLDSVKQDFNNSKERTKTLEQELSIVKPKVLKLEGYVAIPEFGYYKLVGPIVFETLNHKLVSWNAAKKSCEQDGAHLAVIDSTGKANAMVRLLTQDIKYLFPAFDAWIGFSENNEKKWKDVSGNPVEKNEWWVHNYPIRKNDEHGNNGFCASLVFPNESNFVPELHTLPCDNIAAPICEFNN